MALTKPTYDVDNIQSLADQPVESATVLKQTFDKTGADAKTYEGSLVDELESETDGNSGMDNIGMTPINGVMLTPQQSLEYLKIRVDATAPTTNIYSALDNGLVGNGVANDATALNALITLIGSKESTILFTALTTGQAEYLISTNVVFPDNINAEFLNGAILKVSNTFSVTGTDTKLTAGLWQIFDLSLGGTVIGDWDYIEAYTEWFGAAGDAITSDSISFQYTFEFAEINYSKIKLQAKTYYLPTPVRTRNEQTVFTASDVKGITVEGITKGTILKGAGAAVIDYSDYSTYKDQCIFGIHSTSNFIIGIEFIDSPCGVYIGQDPRDPSGGAVSATATKAHLNKFENIYFEDIGTAILFEPGWGSYYNTFDFIKMQYCQIGIHFGLPPFLVDPFAAVSNRNSFKNIYMNNGWCGFLVENGDTNVVDTANFESINGVVNGWSAPTQFHDSNATGIYTDQSAHFYGINEWKCSNIHNEANTRDLYYDGSGWAFFNCVLIMSTKVEVTGTATIGSYVSTGSPSSNYRSAGVHIGDLHVKQAITTVDPFLPNVGATDYGIMVGRGRIADLDTAGNYLGRQEYDIVGQNPTFIGAISASSELIYWQLGGVKELFANINFTMLLGSTVPLRLVLPDGIQPNALFDKPTTADNYKFSAQVRSVGGVLETVYGYFLVTNNKIEIPAPSNGWSALALENFVWFNLRYF